MGQNTKIEWCDATANLWWGCEHVHAGCDNCYAEAWAKRYQPTALWGKDSARMEIKSVWANLTMFQIKAAAAGEIHRVFVGSMMDIFEKPKPMVNREGKPLYSDEMRTMEATTDTVRQFFFNKVVPASPNLDFLLLTKRPSNINKYIPESWIANPPANVMFGTSPVNQATLNTLVHQLRQVNGRRFLSIEPQLAEIRDADLRGIDWIIQGGESGPKKRPFDLAWARSMRDDCQYQNVPYFFKQVDKIQSIPDDLMIRQFPEQPIPVPLL